MKTLETQIEILQEELEDANSKIDELTEKLENALYALDEIKDIAYKAL